MTRRLEEVHASYFTGYRRLADKRSDIRGFHCYNCRHAVCFVNWHCDRGGGNLDCSWSPCHAKDSITKASFQRGRCSWEPLLDKWIGLPDLALAKPDGKSIVPPKEIEMTFPQPLQGPTNGTAMQRLDRIQSLTLYAKHLHAILEAGTDQAGEPLTEDKRKELHARWHECQGELETLKGPPCHPA